MPEIPGASASQYAKSLWGLPSRLVNTNVTASSVSGVVLQNNPTRMQWLIINRGNVEVSITIGDKAVFSQGVLIPPNGGGVQMTAFFDGEVVAYDVHAITAAGSSTLSIVEVVTV